MADLYLRDVPTMEWDTAAAQCVVEQAGGCVQDLEGQTLSTIVKTSAIDLITMGDPSFDWRDGSMEKPRQTAWSIRRHDIHSPPHESP